MGASRPRPWAPVLGCDRRRQAGRVMTRPQRAGRRTVPAGDRAEPGERWVLACLGDGRGSVVVTFM
jgi:hypothetical protein